MVQVQGEKKINVRGLILEVTRRCNQQCAHCLRGKQQQIDMTPETIDFILDHVESIGEVCFSGGEPSLNLSIIEYFFEQSKKKGKLPSYFWLATNGLVNQLELATLLLKWFPEMIGPDLCGVAVSIDQFHEKPKENLFRGLSFYDDSKEFPNGREPHQIVAMGMAKKNGLGFLNPYMNISIDYCEEPDDIYIEDLYVSASGLMVGNCDASYEDIDKKGIPLKLLDDHKQLLIALNSL